MAHAFEDRDEGEILLEVSEDNGMLLFEYSDNGKGIEEENLKKIFDPFFTTSRDKGGSGLGMHIVYNLVSQTLNGQIECKSKLGEGTKFIISIPKTE